MHVRNPEDLTELICPSERFNRFGLSISFDIVSLFEKSVDLVYLFRLVLWKKENFSLLVLDDAYLGPDRVILNGLYVCPSQPKCLESGNDTWRESSHNYV